MLTADLEKTEIYKGLKWSRNPVFGWARPLKKLFFSFFIISFLIFLFGFFTTAFEKDSLSFLLGLCFILLSFAIVSYLRESFLESRLKKPRPKFSTQEALVAGKNMASLLSFDSAKAVDAAIDFAKSKKLSEINSTILLYFLLENNPRLAFVFLRALLNFEEIKKTLKSYLKTLKSGNFVEVYSQDFQNTLIDSLRAAQKRSSSTVQASDLLIGLARNDQIFQKIMVDNKSKPEDIENLVLWQASLERRIKNSKKFWEWENLLKRGSLGKEWTAGYTLTLDQFSFDLTEIMKKKGFPAVVGHQKEVEALERILARREYNNAMLVGEPGVGKKSIIQGLAAKSLLGQSLDQVNYKRVAALDVRRIMTQTQTREEFNQVLDRIFQEVLTAGNIILIINDFHNFVADREQGGIINISGILSPYLESPAFQVIAITNYRGLHRNIEKSPALLALFEKVEAAEISEQETLVFLENQVPFLEKKYKAFVSYAALKQLIEYSARYITNKPFPKKAVDLLDEVMVYVARQKGKIVLPKDVAKIVAEKTEIPVGELEIKEKETLLNLEDLIHQRIINQEEAVKEVASALRRARTEVAQPKGPMGAFLFLGPTGVGKTETAKALTQIYFSSESRMIRMDMSEFQNVTDIPRLLGSATEEGLLTTSVRENPFSMILLDEIEKAHPNILNLFLQVLDEGFLTDGQGRKIDFKNTIIIATSNAGYKIILQALKEKGEWGQLKQKLLDNLFEKGVFRPEFINRFDAVVIFKPLSKENLFSIADLMLQKTKKSLKEKGIEFSITEELKSKIVELGYDSTFGARQMRRAIQDNLENVLAKALLSGELKRGDRVEVNPEDFSLIHT